MIFCSIIDRVMVVATDTWLGDKVGNEGDLLILATELVNLQPRDESVASSGGEHLLILRTNPEIRSIAAVEAPDGLAAAHNIAFDREIVAQWIRGVEH